MPLSLVRSEACWRDQFETKLWAVPSGKLAEPIAWDMRGHGREFAFAAELVEAEIREHAFTHDGDAVIERHIVNCRIVDTRWGVVTVGKETPTAPTRSTRRCASLAPGCSSASPRPTPPRPTPPRPTSPVRRFSSSGHRCNAPSAWSSLSP